MDRSSTVPFAPPLVGQEEIDAVVDTLRSGWLTTGPKTRQFEAEFAAAVGAPAALAVNSCTAALHLALLTAGVGPGDEVITSCWTFAATVNVIEHVGATPVVVDVDPETLNLDLDRVHAAITPRTKAVVPVHFAGRAVDLDRLGELARRHNLRIIEDAAHACGAAHRGRPIGGGDSLAAFSFYATKNLATGEGGMLTGPADVLDRARVASLHGLSREAWNRYCAGGAWRYDVACAGFKYNMTDIQAALGLAQLHRFPAMQSRRREIVAAYNAAFGDRPELVTPGDAADADHAWHLYVLRLRPSALAIHRDQFIDELTARGIGTSVHFIPIPLHSHYQRTYGWRIDDFPVARQQFEQVVSLPLSAALTDDHVAAVIAAVTDVVERFAVRRAAA
jgi:dTDP-4-amino-4,6-dideoxygalactose transaminase